MDESPYQTAARLKAKYRTPEPTHMHIKIVPDDDPNAKGEWIKVPLRSANYRSWVDTERAYKNDIPDGYHAVSFDRFGDRKW